MTLSRNAQATLALAAVSLLAAVLILERWMVTDLGVRSFGRVWAFYVNYFDFGFVRRGLVGTVLQATPLPDLFSNAYHFALAVQHVALATLVALAAAYFLRSKGEQRPLFKAVVFLSPAFILQAAYTTGSLDIFVLIIAFLNILVVRSRVLFCALLFVGPLVHELFVFTVPAQLTAYYLRHEGELAGDLRRTVRLMLPPLAAITASLLAILLFGATELPREEFEATMARLIPDAVDKVDLWSGYFEVGSSVSENSRSLGFLASNLATHALYLVVPLSYAAALLLLVLRNEPRLFPRLLLIGSAATPFLVYVVATDFYRWVGMSANMSLLLLMLYASRQALRVSRTALAIVLAFSLFAPFGGAVIDNPLPMHKFVVKKLSDAPSTD